MSRQNVVAFYQRMKSDRDFQAQIQGVQNKQECSKIVRAAGYYFTQAEFEEYTAELLESNVAEEELQNLDEKELEAVMGGASSIIGLPLPFPYPKPIPFPIPIPMYGVILPHDLY